MKNGDHVQFQIRLELPTTFDAIERLVPGYSSGLFAYSVVIGGLQCFQGAHATERVPTQ